MSLPENEVAAANQQRRTEDLAKSTVGEAIGQVAVVTGPAISIASTLAVTGSSAAAGLTLAAGFISSLGLVDLFRKFGSTKVNENLEVLGQATEDALIRVEKNLSAQSVSVDEIKARIESEAFRDGMASAALQALRTTQKDRLQRMARILANGVKEKDLEPENFDDMMRAAAELQDADILLLGQIYQQQSMLLEHKGFSSEWSQQVGHQWVNSFATSETKHLSLRGSLSRLESLGFLGAIRTMITPNGSLAHQAYGLLPEGARFYKLLQDVSQL